MKKTFLFLGVFLLAGSLRADDIIYQNIGPFGGLNNTDSPIAIPANKASDLLNIDVSPGGKSVLKRKGYALFSNLAISTSPVHGVHNFFDSSGNSVDLYFNDRWISASIGGAAVTVLSSTGSSGATWQCVDSQGFAYCNSSARTSLLRTNGATFSYINSVNSTGTMVAVTTERLVTSGFAEAPNRVDFSKANAFSIWTIGSAATDAAQFTIVSPGSRITHIVYAFGRIIWFKDSSFGFIAIGQETAQADWQIKTISPNVGTLDNTSVYWEGILYFRGQDGHIYAYDGSNLTKLTRDLEGTISVSGNRTTSSWSQSSQADFETSSMTPLGFLSTTINPGAIVLSTAIPIGDFVDDTAANFGAANSVVNLDTTTTSGSVFLSTVVVSKFYRGNDPFCSDVYVPASNSIFQSFLASSTLRLTHLSFLVNRTGTPGNATIRVLTDNTLKPGTTVAINTANFDTVSTSTYEFVTVQLSSIHVVQAGSRYWVGISMFGDASNSIAFVVNTAGCGGIGGDSTWLSPGGFRNETLNYSFNSMEATGTIVSRTFDNGFSPDAWIWDWSTFYASGTVPSGTSISYETQTSSDSACLNCFDSFVSVSSGSSPTSTVKRYFRYRASFTTNSSTSPVLTYIEENLTSRLRPYGTYYSQVNNITGAISAWDSFTANKIDNGGTQNFYIRAASGPFSIVSSTPLWTAISAGAVPSISTGAYIQIKDEFSVSKATQNPTLNDFTISWFEGQASDKAYASYFKDAIWWSIASGVSVSTNNRVLRLDLINQDWYLYDIGTNGMLVRNNALYFGSSSAGKIFKFGDTDNDNGSAIQAYWKSKDFVLGNPFVKKEFVNLSVSAGSVANSSATITYAIDGSSSTTYQFPLFAGSNFYRHFNKNLPLGRIGSTFNVQFGNNGADQFFEVFAVQYGFRDKPWVPTQ